MFCSTMNSTMKLIKRVFCNPSYETVEEFLKRCEKKKKKDQGSLEKENVNYENKFFIKSCLLNSGVFTIVLLFFLVLDFKTL